MPAFLLAFPTGEAKLAKSENGENPAMTFDDGAKLEAEGFYTTFDKDNLPTLDVDGQDITGKQPAAGLGEDSVPAAVREDWGRRFELLVVKYAQGFVNAPGTMAQGVGCPQEWGQDRLRQGTGQGKKAR